MNKTALSKNMRAKARDDVKQILALFHDQHRRLLLWSPHTKPFSYDLDSFLIRQI